MPNPAFIHSARVFCRSCLLLGLLVALPAAAQRRHRAVLPPPGGYTREDTVYAVRRLFNGRDKDATYQLARSLGVMTASGTATLLPPPFGRPQLKQSVVAVGLGSGLIGAGLGVWRMRRFSHKRRDEVLAAYQQGEPLPTFVRRRLRPGHFRADKQAASVL
jgi:hypothetical protein